MMNKRNIGDHFEQIGCDYLIKKGYEIISRNYRYHRHGEIDIIAKTGNCIVFVEVKARKNTTYGTPAEAVTLKKRDKIRMTALGFLSMNKMQAGEIRFDVLEIYYDYTGIKSIHLIENAF